MAKFKRGDVVSWVSPITKKEFNGVIREFATGYEEPSYRVDVAGYKGFPIVPEKWLTKNGVPNSRARNAKFKVGGKVLITKGFQKGKVGKVLDGPIYDDQGEFYRVFVCGLSEDYDASFLKAANSRACNSTNPVVAKAMNAVARNSTEDLQILLQTADTDIDDGDIDEAKQILRETRTRAIRSGYTREWMEVAKRVGMK